MVMTDNGLCNLFDEKQQMKAPKTCECNNMEDGKSVDVVTLHNWSGLARSPL